MSGTLIRAGIVVAVLAAVGAPTAGFAQQGFSSGQTIAPAYEGWEQNADGSFNLVFGYMNRNWEEMIDVPVGPDNSIEPGGPDQGQPTHFYPRRNRFVFRIRVPADFGDKELVWTLKTQGRTERAYATLKRDYFIDDLVIQANFGAGGGGGTTPELPENQAPTLDIEGGGERTVRAGEPLELVAVSTDDGKPRARSMPASSPRHPGRFTTDTATGHRLSWFVYRGAGEVAFDPPQIKVWEDTRIPESRPGRPDGRRRPPLPMAGGSPRRRSPSPAITCCAHRRTTAGWPRRRTSPSPSLPDARARLQAPSSARSGDGPPGAGGGAASAGR